MNNKDRLNKASFILTKLKENGHEAYFVGGCVRDYYLNKEFNDIDINTSASVDEIIDTFDKVKKTGIKFGCVTVIHENEKYEVTTYRHDSEYKNHRHPSVITFQVPLEEDLKRRDFTVNSLVMDENFNIEFLLDYQKEDFTNKCIRAIGNPKDRFYEDALRILRAFYFASKLKFSIHKDTLEAINECAVLLDKIAIERILDEFNKMFSYEDNYKIAKLLLDSKVIEVFPIFKRTFELMVNKKIDLSFIEILILSTYYTNKIDERFKLSNKDLQIIKSVINLIEALKGEDYNPLIVYSNSINNCYLANKLSMILFDEKDKTEQIKDIYDNLPIKKTCDLVFKGQDIMKLSDKRAASWIGNIVDEIKMNVVMGILPNDYEVLKEYALELINEGDE